MDMIWFNMVSVLKKYQKAVMWYEQHERDRYSGKTAEKKKLGFPIPIRVWLKEEKYYNIVKEMFESDAAKKFFDTKLLLKMLDDHKNGKNTNEKTDNSRKIWTVYIFLVWYDRFFEHGKPVHPAMSVQ